MTVMTKPILEKVVCSETPTTDVPKRPRERGILDRMGAVFDMGPTPGHASAKLTFFLVVLAMLIAFSLFICGLEFYRDYVTGKDFASNYEVYCTVPADEREDDIDPRIRNRITLRFSPELPPRAEISTTTERVISPLQELALHEKLDIGRDFEKISVYDMRDAAPTEFIHDFSNNVTGIVTDKRCYMKHLDYEMVLIPSMFMMTINSNGTFDVTRIRSVMRPVPTDKPYSKLISRHCGQKRTISLEKLTPKVDIRSVAGNTEMFTYFSGKGVHEIIITNVDDLDKLDNAVPAIGG